MELEPDITNVLYIDEYPELKKRVWLRRLAASRAAGEIATECSVSVIDQLRFSPDDSA